MLGEFKVSLCGKEYPVFYIDSLREGEEAIKRLLLKPGILAADLETAAMPEWRHIPDAALSPHLSRPRLLQVFTGTAAVVLDLFRIGEIDLATLFNTRPSVFHNIGFDLKFLRKYYGVTSSLPHCTLIMARIINHALYTDVRRADLGSATGHFLGVEINKRAGATDWSVPDLTFEQISYAAADVIVLHKLYEKLNVFIDQLGLRKVYELYRKAQLSICKIELNGISIDCEKHRGHVIKWREELADSKDELLALTRLDSITGPKIATWLQETLPEEIIEAWPRTEKGAFQTDSFAFSEHSDLDIVVPIARYQKLKTSLCSFGLNLLALINPATKKLHPHYHVAGAKTGRLSSSSPNIQNQPRSFEMRSVYVPTEGYTFIDIDYAQIEPRILAEFSQDQEMLKVYRDKLDLYTYTASKVLNKPVSEVTKQERQYGKSLALGLMYMLGAKGFKRYAKKTFSVDVNETQSEELVDAYRKAYPDLRNWQLQQVNQCMCRCYTAFSKLGKSRRFDEDAFYAGSVNHPIQSTAAEVMLTAIVDVDHSLEGTGAWLTATVHDELLITCPTDSVEDCGRLCETVMENAYRKIMGDCVTANEIVKASSGPSWAEAK